jgi:hypothetical protein
MRLDIEITPDKGYIIDKELGQYVAKEATTGKILTKPFDRIREARLSAEAANHRRSFNRITNVEATFPQENYKTLQNARAAIIKAKEADSPEPSNVARD